MGLVYVTNLDRSFDFYKNVLGFSPKLRWGEGAYFMSGDLWLVLIVDKHVRKSPHLEYSHIAFNVDENKFSEVSDHIVKSGAKIFKKNSSEGLSLYFLDPDGYKLEVHHGDINSRLEHYRKKDSKKYIFFDE